MLQQIEAYIFQSFSADLHMEGSSVRAPPGRTNFATLRIVPPTPLTTERSSVLSSTANSSGDGTTAGDHTVEWMVRQMFHSFLELLRKTIKQSICSLPVAHVVIFFPPRSRCM